MAERAGLDWLLEMHEEQRSTLYRLAVLLGAGDEASDVVRDALLALQRRARRVVDPTERVEFLQEQVVHLTRGLGGQTHVPPPDDDRHLPVLDALQSLSPAAIELLVVSHFLGVYGPELAGVMRLSTRGTNQLLESSLGALARIEGGDATQEAVSQDLTDAVRAAAAGIRVPADDELPEELERRSSDPVRGRVRGQYAAVACIVALALGTLGAVATNDRPMELLPTPEPTVTEPTPSPSSAAPVAVQAIVRQSPIYYVGRSDRQLYRELRDLPTSASLAQAGVNALFTLAPSDPDYASLWAGTVNEVSVEGNTLTVDLSEDTYEAIAPEDIVAAIDQMVYTSSELLGNPLLTVRFLADGGSPPSPFDADGGFTRRGLQPMAGLWVTSPRNQLVTQAGTITVTGVTKPEFGAPVVTITDRETKGRVANSIAQTSLSPNDEGWLAWSVAVTLDNPGDYEVSAVVSLQGEPAGAVLQASDNKVIRVVG